MDLSHLSAQDLGAILDSDPQRLSDQLYQLINGGAAPPSFQSGFGLGGGGGVGFSISSTYAESPLLHALQAYSSRLIGAQILAGLLLADVLGLVLIFLAQMARMLVDRQEPLIALLRSRGASRGQIFGAFVVQTLLLGVVGLVAGAALALPATRIVSSALLPTSERNAMSILNGSFVTFSTGAAIAAGLTAIALVLAMLRSVGRASALNTLALRQESARPARKPLWQRLYLDVAAALLAFLAYGTYALADKLATGASSSGPNDVGIALSPLAVIAPAFLMVAGALLFLRLFPLLLRVAEGMAGRGSSVAPVLALAQLARSARKTASIVLPLALATCFLLFVLAANATIEQQMADAAAFQTGADFSGGLAPVVDTSAAARQARADAYLRVPGVLSVSLGYRGVTLTIHCNPNTQDCGYTEYDTVQIEAVDAESFFQTAIWPAQDATQPLAPLMAKLAAARDAASARGAVPVILDGYSARLLGVAPGASFTLPAPIPADIGTADLPDMRFSVVAVVPYLPGLYGGSGGGLLADYATFAAVYRQVMPGEVAPNFVWLRTASDAASLARIRAAIANGPLALSRLETVPVPVPVSDRRALAASLHGDPLRLTVTGILDLGAVAALLLALCGALIASGVAARERRTALALLRALGTAPRSVRAAIAWEQGIVYTVALALGALLGAVLIEVMLPPLPTLIFASALGGPIENGAPPVRIIWPWPALAATVGALVLISALATTLAARAASRPSLAALLRLSGEQA
jgi:putative ABC transport system permease protein